VLQGVVAFVIPFAFSFFFFGWANMCVMCYVADRHFDHEGGQEIFVQEVKKVD
jgi:hypothetical protein